jgi:hypothetical protein
MPQAIAAVAAYATAEFIALTASTSVLAASAVYATVYAATAFAVYTGINYGLSAIQGGGGAPDPRSQGQLVSSTAPVSANRHVIGRARVAGVTAWQGSFAWNGPRPVGGGELDILNKGFGQAQVLSSTPITEIEGIYAADILLTGVAETYTGANVALAANMLPYNKSQPAGQSRLYYRSTVGAAIGTRDTLLGWFADQSWQPQISSPDPATPGDVPFYSPTARGDGLAMLFSAAYQDVDSFPQGPPRMSAVVKGVAVFDPRDPDHDSADPDTWAFTQNPALLAAWYVTRPFSFDAHYSEIDTDALIAAANACDEVVATFSSTGSSTEARFYCGGEITEEDNRDSTLAAICASMAGSWCIVGGMWFFYAGVYSEPTLAIDDTWIMRGIEFTAQRSRLQLYNTVNGSFVSEARRWQASPYPQVQDPALLALDNGIEIIEKTELAFVQSHTVAQRVILIELRRTHKPRSFKFEAPLGYAMRLAVGMTVALTQTPYGITDIPFRVSSWELTQQDDTGQIWATITLDEDGADIYDIGIGQLTDAPALADPDPINGDGEPADGGDPTTPPTGTGESVVV